MTPSHYPKPRPRKPQIPALIDKTARIDFAPKLIIIHVIHLDQVFAHIKRLTIRIYPVSLNGHSIAFNKFPLSLLLTNIRLHKPIEASLRHLLELANLEAALLVDPLHAHEFDVLDVAEDAEE